MCPRGNKHIWFYGFSLSSANDGRGLWTLVSTGLSLSGTNAEVVRCDSTLEEWLQNAIHYTLGQKPPLEDGMVGATCADDPLQVVGPANVRHVGGVTNVLLKFGSLRKKDVDRHSAPHLTPNHISRDADKFYMDQTGRQTFLQAREPEEFDKTKIISGHQDSAAVVGIHRVHVGQCGIFGPDAVHLRPNNTSPRHPMEPLRLLLRNKLPCCRT